MNTVRQRIHPIEFLRGKIRRPLCSDTRFHPVPQCSKDYNLVAFLFMLHLPSTFGYNQSPGFLKLTSSRHIWPLSCASRPLPVLQIRCFTCTRIFALQVKQPSAAPICSPSTLRYSFTYCTPLQAYNYNCNNPLLTTIKLTDHWASSTGNN